MTICPFMSRPVPMPHTHPDKWWLVGDVKCRREKCAAWGPIEPLWIIERDGGETREYYVTFHEGRWRRIPKKPDAELILCGCRRLGAEVPE